MQRQILYLHTQHVFQVNRFFSSLDWIRFFTIPNIGTINKSLASTNWWYMNIYAFGFFAVYCFSLGEKNEKKTALNFWHYQ